jgi:hypothetical protein
VFWRILLTGAAAGAAFVPLPSAYVERLYSSGLYARLQPMVTGTTNLVPFALLDFLLAAAAAALAWLAVARIRARERPLVRRAAALLGDTAAAGAAIYLLFLLLWGLNYRREPAETRFQVEARTITADRVARFVERTTDALNRLYPAARAGSQAASAGELAAAFASVTGELDPGWRPVPGRPKPSLAARLFPLGGVDGMMNPWGLEVLVNPEVLPFERTFVVAHEWAHLAGHARESEASFVGWLTCMRAGASAQYSGWLALFLHGVRSLPAADWPDAIARLEPGPRADLEAVRERTARVSPMVHRTAWRAYDRYLRANRVESGVANYDEVVTLALGSRLSTPWLR